VRFVITLDSDTQLPLGSARRMIETLAHPLNQPRFDAAGRILAGSYTIIQPRVSPTLPSTTASPFSRLFADAVGIDPTPRRFPMSIRIWPEKVPITARGSMMCVPSVECCLGGFLKSGC